MRHRFHEDVAAFTTDTAVGAAAGHERLAAEAHAAAPSIARLDEDFDPIDEHWPTAFRGCGRARRRLTGGGQHAHAKPACSVIFELHDAVRRREDGVVLGQTRVPARLPLRSVLPHDDGSARYLLATEALDAQSLRVAVAAV